jgi:hypothetical protein
MSMLDYLITPMLVLATKDIDVNEYAGLFIFTQYAGLFIFTQYAGLFIFTQYAGLFIFAHLLFVLVLFPNSPLSNKS